MYRDVKGLVGQNSEVLADMLGLVLTLCGLIPGAGEACDVADAALSAQRGDWVGSLLSGAAAIPLVGYGATALKCLKYSDRIRNVINLARRLGDSTPRVGCARGSCGIPRGSCFVAGTLVRAEHGQVPIEKIKPGDRVWSRNMATGRDELQPVHAVYTRRVIRLLTLTIAGESVTTTVDHPFHVAGQGFTRAISLKPGDALTTSAGTIPLEAKSLATETVTVYNLNIANTHTYYILTGHKSILVHNANASGPCGDIASAADWRIADAEYIAQGHAGTKHAGDFPGMSISDLKELVQDVMTNPLKKKDLQRGRTAYLGQDHETIVIHDPGHEDGGTVFRRIGDVDEYWEVGLQ
jgi:hypothetical protein